MSISKSQNTVYRGEKIMSPLTGEANVVVEKEITADEIVALYRKDYKIDVAGFFTSASNIFICRCLDTNFRFYYPFDIDGDAAFYKQLQRISWYYEEWKWEYEVAKNFISTRDKVLEVGCGKGAFLKYLNKTGVEDCQGLELNDDVLANAERENINIKIESIQLHAEKHKNLYDVVCYFQVLEHIAQPFSFIKSSLETLKPGGQLIIAVPFNEPYFFRWDVMHTLNLPPHHMGLWNDKAFEGIQDLFGIKLKRCIIEPLSVREAGLFLDVNLTHYKQHNKLIYNLLKKIPLNAFKSIAKYLKGRNILVVYTKN